MNMNTFRSLALISGVLVLFCGRTALAATNKTLGSYDTSGTARDVVVLNNVAFVADGSSGVIALDISSPSSPTLIGSYDTPGTAVQLDAAGNYLFVADSTSLTILNISSPSAISLSGSYSQTGLTINDLTTDGTYAYILGSLNGVTTFEIINISNPAAPVLKGSLAVNAGSGLTLSGTYAYLAGANFVDIVNITNVSSPSLTGEYVGGVGLAFDSVQVIGSYAYVNDAQAGLQVVNISSPAAPTLTSGSTVPGSGLGGGLTTSNGYLFLNSSTGNVVIYDIYSTGLPVFVDTYSTPANGYGIAVADTIAVVASGEAGVQLIDVSKPDTVPPTITLKGGGGVGTVPPVITVGGKFVDPGAIGLDNVDGSLLVSVTGTVDTSTVGKYKLTYTLTDRAGNTTSVTRTIIIAPSITTITGTKGVYVQKVNGKKITFRPFLSYTGTIYARKLIVHKLTDPMFLFVATSPYGKPAVALFSYQGKLLTRVDLTKLSTKGLHLDLLSDPSTLSVIVTLNSTSPGTIVRAFTISKSGLKAAGNLTVSSKPALIIEKVLKFYTNEVGIATMVKGKTSTIRIWRYSTKTKTFLRDTKYVLSTLALTGTSIKLK